MRILSTLAAAAVLALAAGCGAAHADPSARFVSQDGYAAMDADRAWDEVNAALTPSDPQSVFRPAANLAPMTLALLALEASEPALERVRYRLRHGTDWVEASPGGAPHPVSYVEVTRFNLGPAIRRELVELHGAATVADAAEFGVGPHVAWRLVTQPVMGNRAMVVAAGRMEIDEDTARGEVCLGGSCLDTRPGINAAAPWGEMEQVAAEADAGPGGAAGNVATPAQALQLLLGEVDDIETDRAPNAPAIPDWAIEAVVETGLGQDAGLDSAYRWGGRLDDSVAATWQRLVSFPTGGPEPETLRASAYECARGPEFAQPGGYCP